MHYEQGMALRDGDVSVLAVPASHVTGLVAIILTMLRVGGCTVLMPAFKARDFLEIAARERMTHALLVPAMYNLCLLDPDFAKFDLRRWRIGGFGGAPMPQATIERIAAALPNLTLVNVYGSTETTSPVTMLPLGEAATRADTVGKALPCADVDRDGRRRPRSRARHERRIVDRRSRWSFPATGRTRKRTAPRSAAATGNPATSARSTRKAMCACSTARRT